VRQAPWRVCAGLGLEHGVSWNPSDSHLCERLLVAWILGRREEVRLEHGVATPLPSGKNRDKARELSPVQWAQETLLVGPAVCRAGVGSCQAREGAEIPRPPCLAPQPRITCVGASDVRRTKRRVFAR
jgi:hypothetical protein